MTCIANGGEICGGPADMSMYRVHDASVIGEKCGLCRKVHIINPSATVLLCAVTDNAAGFPANPSIAI